MKKRQNLLSLGAFTAMLVAPVSAQAQVPDSFYRDVRDVIEDLIVTEARTKVSSKLACQSAGLRRYYWRSLEDIYKGYLGGLRSTLREETSTLAADWLFLSIQQQSPKKLSDLLEVNLDEKRCTPNDDKNKVWQGDDETDMQDVWAIGAAREEPYYDLQCKSPASLRDQLACEAAHALSATLGGHHDIAEEHTRRLVRVLLLTVAKENLTGFDSDLEKKLADRLSALLSDPSARSKLIPVSLEALRKAYKAMSAPSPVMLQTKMGDADQYAAALQLVAHLRSAVFLPGTHAQRPLAPLLLNTGTNLPDLASQYNVSLTLNGWDVVPAPAGPTSGNVLLYWENARKILRLAEALEQELGDYTGLTGMERLHIVQLVLSAAQIGQSWKSLSARRTSKVDLYGLIEVLFREEGLQQLFCETGANSTTCRELDAVRKVMNDPLTKPLLEAAVRQDYRRVASLAIVEGFELATGDPDETSKLYGAFLNALTSYALDSAGEGANDATRVALKKQASELLRREELGRGFDHRGSREGFRGSFWQALLYPTLSLRASYSEAYVTTTKDRYRSLASIEWLSFGFTPRASDTTYLTFQISLIDALAPFAELAMRDKKIGYDKDWRILSYLIQPRLSVYYGMPALSSHLVVGAGVSVRPVTSLLKSDGSMVYQPAGKLPADLASQLAPNQNRTLRHLEGGVNVGYMF